jgi:F0F1-type ATP synthase membrane subunit a
VGLISTLTSNGSTVSSLSSTTSSAIALSVIITCSIIAIGVLIFLLALADVMSKSDSHTAATRRLQMVAALIPEWRDSSSAQRTEALQVIYVPLIVTFCAFVVFAVARLV